MCFIPSHPLVLEGRQSEIYFTWPRWGTYSYSVTCSFWSNVYPKDQFYLYHGMKLWQYILLPTSLFVQNIDADYFVEYYRQCHDVCRLFVFGWQTYKNVHVHCSMNQLRSAFCTDLHTSLHSIAAQNDDWNPPFL